MPSIFDRSVPQTPQEQKKLFLIVSAILVILIVVFVSSTQGGGSGHKPAAVKQPSTVPASQLAIGTPIPSVDTQSQIDTIPPAAISSAALDWAPGYLSYIFGLGSLRSVTGSTAHLLSQIGRYRPSTADRLNPHVIAVRGQAQPGNAWLVTMLVQDRQGQFPIAADFVQKNGQWLADSVLAGKAATG